MSFDYSSLPPSYYSSPSSTFPTTTTAAAPSAPHKSSKTRSKPRDHNLIDPEGAASIISTSSSTSKHRKHKSKHHHHKSSSSTTTTDSSKSKSKKKPKKKKKDHSSSSSSSSSEDESNSNNNSNNMSNTFSMQSVSSSLSSIANSHRAQLAATALVSGLVVGGTILGYQSSKRRIKTQMLKESISNNGSYHESEEGDMERSVDLSHFLAHSTTPSSVGGNGSIPYNPPPYTLSPSSTSTPISNNAPSRSTPSTVQPKSITDAESTALAKHAQSLASKQKPIPEELILEQLSRTHSFLGTQGLRTIRSSFVIIVGLGGVGSWCATMLVRSGIGRVRLIDFDQVTLSSLNRHAVATLEDVGTPKVLAMKKRLQAVAPWVEVEACVELWSEKDGKRLLDGEPDWVVDAIDNIDTKVDLLAYCHGQGIPVISSMGAGCKSDPTRILIGDISETTEDPLSKSTRRRLRQRGIPTGITVVYSTEKPGPGKANLLPLSETSPQEDPSELSVLENFRVRILPVLGTMPATFGLAAANHVLCKLAEYPLEYLPSQTRFRPQFYGQVINQLVAVESRIRNNLPGLKVPVSEADAGYILEEVFGGKSVISGLGNRLHLVRWYSPEATYKTRFEDGSTITNNNNTSSEPVNERETKLRLQKVGVGIDGAIFLKLSDLVVMTKEEVKIHEKRVLIGGEDPAVVWGRDVQETVEKKWAVERAFSKWRD
ncbi:hypothetical protein TWF730_003273 [Orbilia blumenaviensis]|uniref:THIF-type NAD/FAD binding fold domain-containing protein n=1 Tax=Orbilia blumenaviensis TaxID=1796055 RepID=A0AAV9U4S6_9PEZI